jgi:hypothetical protein
MNNYTLNIEANANQQILYKYLVSTVVLCLSAGLLFKLHLLGAIGLLVLPILGITVTLLFKRPKAGLWMALMSGFLTSGMARYVNAPWGLSLDIILVATWVAVFFNKNTKWERLNNDLFYLTTLWFVYLVFEMFNPNANSIEAWFYAMRGIGFYQFLSVGLAILLFDNKKDLNIFFFLIIAVSIFGTIWGFKQQLGIMDFAENRWLYEENHHEEHILHGVLRVFSFYSDAGQFGASQAMVSLICFIMFLAPGSKLQKIIYLIAGIICLLGFAISGTRGALAVPFFGGVIYLFISKNFKLLITGFASIGIVFFILKYTFLFQGVEQIRRMRSALDPNNRSLEVRLENQKTFGAYLADKPFGGGVGTAGFWGHRFNPNSLMANTATDSWYVKIWAETGVVGICMHLGLLAYIMGKSCRIISRIEDPDVKNKNIALYAALGGILFASYGNQVFGQMPTGMIMNLTIPFLFISESFKNNNHENNS